MNINEECLEIKAVELFNDLKNKITIVAFDASDKGIIIKFLINDEYMELEVKIPEESYNFKYQDSGFFDRLKESSMDINSAGEILYLAVKDKMFNEVENVMNQSLTLPEEVSYQQNFK